MNLVYDAGALIALIEDEPGGDRVEALIKDQSNSGIVHTINMCEVFYDARRRHGEEAAQAVYEGFLRLGLSVHDVLDEDLWQAAARIKADYRRISLADCICVALANQIGGEVVTNDRREMEPLAADGVCKVIFIR